ncbi:MULTISPECIES: glycoside hydrolase family 140 protein [unclassified Pseudonocardia]|uniref:glycoside hydrolase family 140 protein n=1 Tax=unclassified Pseudonocardia TaxID=2619320 RepID=UPI0009E87D66|nr:MULTISPECIES: glycoside hydrolase family 140 protein [unclassified Pseudonocardia]
MPRPTPSRTRRTSVALGVALSVGVLAAAGVTSSLPSRGPDRSEGPAGPPPVPAADAGTPRLETDGRWFSAGGRPFFWLGDTAWALLGKADREETLRYLDTRAAQGYTVIQTVAIFPQAGATRPVNGDVSSVGEHDEFWDRVDAVIDAAAERGLYLAIHPVWGDDQTGSVVDEGNAGAYGRFIGERYGDRDNVTWTLGGDHPADGEEELWAALAEGLDAGGGTQLTTYHPQGDQSSAQWFAGAPWLDFHMIQGGHCLRYDVRRELVGSTYAATPARPFVDGEPIYEDHPYCWEPDQGFSTAQDVRRDAYWAVLGGAAGHTYGAHAVWQFSDGGSGELGARGSWTDALELPAGRQMVHLRDLMTSLPFTQGEPAPSVLASDTGSGADRIVANRAADGSYLLVYTPSGRSVALRPGALDGTARAQWFDPRTGEYRDAPRSGGEFAPPSDEDWVLVARR